MYFETSVDIKASADTVWATLVDVEHWPDFTASVTRARLLTTPPLALGSKARIKQPGFPELVWEVTDLHQGTAFTWRAHSPGVTTVGVHRVSAGIDSVRVTLSIRQTGALSAIVGWMTGARTRKYVQIEAGSLKQRCEAQSLVAQGLPA
jgi:uncharacterized membrane protein